MLDQAVILIVLHSKLWQIVGFQRAAKEFSKMMTGRTLIALGANIAGTWGWPLQTLRAAVAVLGRTGVTVERVSALYESAPLGRSRQPPYLNAVVSVRSNLPPASLLRALKRIESAAGRRRVSTPTDGPRPLDLDLIDAGGRVIGWPPWVRCRGRITLPHPQAHRRAFVLVPLLGVALDWVHPVLKIEGRRLLANRQVVGRTLHRFRDADWARP
jgi:2-amino-4-hydroxy-6-hydroxymethyldihydropteridine diphosphokinase